MLEEQKENALMAPIADEEISKHHKRIKYFNMKKRSQFKQPFLTETSYVAQSLGVNDVNGFVASGLLFYRRRNDGVEGLFAWEKPWDTHKRRYDKPSFNLIGGKREKVFERNPQRTATRAFYQSLWKVRKEELPDWRVMENLAEQSQKLWIPYGKYCLCCIDLTNKDYLLPPESSYLFSRTTKYESDDDIIGCATTWSNADELHPWGSPKYRKQIHFFKWLKLSDLFGPVEVSDLVENLKSLHSFRTFFGLPQQEGNTPTDVFNFPQQMSGLNNGFEPMLQQLNAGYEMNQFPALEQFGMSDDMRQLSFPFCYPSFNRNMFVPDIDDGYVSHNTQAPSVTSTITSNTSQESLLNLASAMQLPPEPCLPLSPPPPESAEAIEYVRRLVLREKNVPPLLAKQWLGELIYVRVEKETKNSVGTGGDACTVGKITGMLLEMDNDTLFNLIDNSELLRKNVKEARDVLRRSGCNVMDGAAGGGCFKRHIAL